MAGNKYDERCSEFSKKNTNTIEITAHTTAEGTNPNATTAQSTTGGSATSCTYGQYPRGETGWICPKCGRGIAPWKSYCDCNDTWTITCGSGCRPNSTGNPIPDWNHVTCDTNSYIYHGPAPKVTLTN